jgi:major membrane immunogen (membrane-anchored lipoprotein)
MLEHLWQNRLGEIVHLLYEKQTGKKKVKEIRNAHTLMTKQSPNGPQNMNRELVVALVEGGYTAGVDVGVVENAEPEVESMETLMTKASKSWSSMTAVVPVVNNCSCQ